MKCIVCNVEFTKRRRNQVTCGAPKCIKANHNPLVLFDEGSVMRCPVCDKIVEVRNTNYKTCGSPECKRKWKYARQNGGRYAR